MGNCPIRPARDVLSTDVLIAGVLMHNKLCGHISTGNTANYCHNPFLTLAYMGSNMQCQTKSYRTQHTECGQYWFTLRVQLWWGLALDGNQQRLQRRGMTSLAVPPPFYAAVSAKESVAILLKGTGRLMVQLSAHV